jgi:2-dehydropantoate 2-reductase
MSRTIAVLGPGAVGGSFAVRFALASFRTYCVAPPETIGLVALAGLSLEESGSAVVNARPVVVEELTTPVDLLLVTVKSAQLEDALERVDPKAVERGVVLPLLNGLEHVEPIRARFDGRVAVGSLSNFEAYRVGRVQIVQTTPPGLVRMASDDLPGVDLERAADLLRTAGTEVEFDESEKRVLWRKLARASVLSVATSLSQRPVGELRTDPSWRPRMEQALAEACAVAAADGVMLMPSAQWTRITELDASLTTSTARDVMAGRPSEIDAIAGSVVRAGERLGVPTPVLARMVSEAAGL